jgi:hypothetical protein
VYKFAGFTAINKWRLSGTCHHLMSR